MAQTTITDLQNRSNLVINETQEGANNEQRVGTLFLDIVDTLNAAIPPVANNLTTTAAGYALDARQGKTLNDKITQLQSDVVILQNNIEFGDLNGGFAADWVTYQQNAGFDELISIIDHARGEVTLRGIINPHTNFNAGDMLFTAYNIVPNYWNAIVGNIMQIDDFNVYGNLVHSVGKIHTNINLTDTEKYSFEIKYSLK